MSIEYLTGTTPSPGKVTPLIDGLAYFNDLFAQINTLKSGDKLYLMNWAIDWDFAQRADLATAPDPNGALLTKLHACLAKGVDVRVMLWANTSLFDPFYPYTPDFFYPDHAPGLSDEVQSLLESGPQKSVMLWNLWTVYFWRNYAMDGTPTNALRDRVVINTLDSMTGGCHSKFALLLRKNPEGEYVGTAYTGGIDFVADRYADKPHSGWNGDNYWHDVMAKVEGAAIVEVIYKFYKDLWNENIGRKTSHNPTILLKADVFTPLGSDTLLPCVPDGAEGLEADDAGPLLFDPTAEADNHLVQSLRTIPDIYPIFGEPELSFATEGSFEFRDALLHAFQVAKHYIYVEDQAMNSLDLFAAVKDALERSDELQIVMITGGDPADAPRKVDKKIINLLRFSDLTAEQQDRLHFFGAPYTIHSKLYMVDDKVAIIGSAGFITRSLTTELEHAVAFIDNNGAQSIKALRDRLWTEHTGVDSSGMSLEEAIASWEGNLAARKIRLEDSTFTDLSGMQDELPTIISKRLSGETLTDEEKERLKALNTFIHEVIKGTIHYLTWEAPYASWLSPSQSPPVVGIPFIKNRRIAVNEATTLELISSQISTVNWSYNGDDALPATGVGDEFETRFSTPGPKTVMALQTFPPTTRKLTYPFTVSVVENSGVQWCDRFEPSAQIEDLQEPFRSKVRSFLEALEAAGVEPEIISTYRPPERAYLMATAYRISRGADPRKIRIHHPKVEISWSHRDSSGAFDLPASRQAATEMVQQYEIGSSGATYPSNHSEGTALDMKVDLASPTLIRNKSNREIRVKTQRQLSAVARTYGLVRLGTTNHWSLSGS